ncbi:hypothetical protein CK203_004542 [Vitis vinifera]|uniref:Uncharacterized protein n=1 Tax=Vitis vinifera TaxID=29760 RepID=A0A438KG75_VITVI|nr:hypothetical protein CK203_004542 [Vitis vinifera]
MPISSSFAAMAIYATEGVGRAPRVEKKYMIERPETLTSEKKMEKKEEEEDKKKSRPSESPWFAPEFDGLHCFETLVSH